MNDKLEDLVGLVERMKRYVHAFYVRDELPHTRRSPSVCRHNDALLRGLPRLARGATNIPQGASEHGDHFKRELSHSLTVAWSGRAFEPWPLAEGYQKRCADERDPWHQRMRKLHGIPSYVGRITDFIEALGGATHSFEITLSDVGPFATVAVSKWSVRRGRLYWEVTPTSLQKDALGEPRELIDEWLRAHGMVIIPPALLGREPAAPSSERPLPPVDWLNHVFTCPFEHIGGWPDLTAPLAEVLFGSSRLLDLCEEAVARRRSIADQTRGLHADPESAIRTGVVDAYRRGTRGREHEHRVLLEEALRSAGVHALAGESDASKAVVLFNPPPDVEPHSPGDGQASGLDGSKGGSLYRLEIELSFLGPFVRAVVLAAGASETDPRRENLRWTFCADDVPGHVAQVRRRILDSLEGRGAVSINPPGALYVQWMAARGGDSRVNWLGDHVARYLRCECDLDDETWSLGTDEHHPHLEQVAFRDDALSEALQHVREYCQLQFVVDVSTCEAGQRLGRPWTLLSNAARNHAFESLDVEDLLEFLSSPRIPGDSTSFGDWPELSFHISASGMRLRVEYDGEQAEAERADMRAALWALQTV